MFSCYGLALVLFGFLAAMVQSAVPDTGILTMSVYVDANCQIPYSTPRLDFDQAYMDPDKGDQCAPATGVASATGYAFVNSRCDMDENTTQVQVIYYNDTVGTFSTLLNGTCPYRQIAVPSAFIQPAIVVFLAQDHDDDNACVLGNYFVDSNSDPIPVYGRFSCQAAPSNSATSTSQNWSMFHISMITVVALIMSSRASTLLALVVLVMMSSIYLPIATAEALNISALASDSLATNNAPQCVYVESSIFGAPVDPNFSDFSDWCSWFCSRYSSVLVDCNMWLIVWLIGHFIVWLIVCLFLCFCELVAVSNDGVLCMVEVESFTAALFKSLEDRFGPWSIILFVQITCLVNRIVYFIISILLKISWCVHASTQVVWRDNTAQAQIRLLTVLIKWIYI